MITNNSLKTIIIDDELAAIITIRSFLKSYCTDVEIVGEAFTVSEAVHLIRTTHPQLILLDIQLQGETGFDILNKFSNPTFQVIFTTAHDSFALKAFQYNAIDYLLKPINPIELVQALDKARVNIQKDHLYHERLAHLTQNYQSKTLDRLTLSSAEGLTFVRLEDIVYLQSDGNYTLFFLQNDEKLIISKSLKDYEKLLPAKQFFRIHQSYLVNIQYVKKILKEDGGSVIMHSGQQLPISRRKKEAFLNLLMEG